MIWQAICFFCTSSSYVMYAWTIKANFVRVFPGARLIIWACIRGVERWRDWCVQLKCNATCNTIMVMCEYIAKMGIFIFCYSSPWPPSCHTCGLKAKGWTCWTTEPNRFTRTVFPHQSEVFTLQMPSDTPHISNMLHIPIREHGSAAGQRSHELICCPPSLNRGVQDTKQN